MNEGGLNSTQPIIKLENVGVTYFLGRANEVKALKDISLEIYPGEFVIFFGPSGCGKSTLLYSIAGLETHVYGKVNVGGKSLPQMTQKEISLYRQKKIGMIFQAFYLINSLSVFKNVMLPQIAIKADLISRRKKAKELLQHFGVADQSSKLPSELSGGQQQRVAICRALINEPEIILADEPVGNLDSKAAADVMQLISELNRNQLKTIVLVTHDPSHLNLAHRVFYMKDGRITETKVNRTIESVRTLQPEIRPQVSISQELELLIKTYSSIAPEQIGGLLIPFKAKQIVSDVLTSLSVEEVEKLESQVTHLLIANLSGGQEFVGYLDSPIEKGGLGLDRRTAQKLDEKIQNILTEIRVLQEAEEKLAKAQVRDAGLEVTQLRQYLSEALLLSFHNPEEVKRFDQALTQRLDSRLDRLAFQKKLDTAFTQGGVGLDSRTAKKVAKRLELLMLGKFNS